MAIRITDLLPTPTYVKVNNKEVEIKPLTLEKIISLLAVYRYDLIVMFSDTVSGDLNLITLVATAPRMVADILAYGMGADGQQDDIVKLPGFSQVELLAEIWKVSVPDAKKLMSLLSGAMAGLQQAGISPALPESAPTQEATESPITESPQPQPVIPVIANPEPNQSLPQEQGSTTT